MVGKNLSHYKILEELGRGGMGIVYKAEDTKLDRTVAIKVLPSAALASKDDRERFYREAKAAAQLHHPHIASIFEIDEAIPEGSHSDDLRPFIAMEFIEGESLDDRIRQGPLDFDESVRIATQVAEALKAADSKDIVHRDIKSANIMLTSEGQAKVLDFGLAKTGDATQLTQDGSSLGTVAYMSPEQARAEKVDHRTDLWALGVVLYEMIAGRRPFEGTYDQAVIYSLLNVDPAPLTELRPETPPELESLVDKLLRKNPEERYQSASAVLADLSPDLSSEETAVRTPTQTASHIPRWALWVSLVVLAALAVYGLLPDRGEDPSNSIQANRLVVLPFEVQGVDDADILQEEILDVLKVGFMGYEDVESADPNQILATAHYFDGQNRIEAGSEIAQRLGAGWFVLGSVRRIEDQTTSTARLYSVEDLENPRELGRFGLEGGLDFAPVGDTLAQRVVSIMLNNPSMPLRTIAGYSTSSPEAFKHYLEGERHFRESRNTEAQVSFGEAIKLDSTFALAAYQGAYAWSDPGTEGGPEMADSLIRLALRHSSKMPRLYASLAQYNLDDARGMTFENASAFWRDMIRNHPDDALVLQYYGDFLYHRNPAAGRPALEGRDYIARGLRLAGGDFTHVANHGAELARGERDEDRLLKERQLQDSLSSQPIRARLDKSSRLVFLSEEERFSYIDSAMVADPTISWWLNYALIDEDFHGAYRGEMARHQPSKVSLVRMEAALGRFSKVREHAVDSSEQGYVRNLFHRVQAASWPFSSVEEEELLDLENEVLSWTDMEMIEPVKWQGEGEQLKLHMLGVLAFRQNDPEKLREVAAEAALLQGKESLGPSYVVSETLNALVMLLEGDREGALERLMAISPAIPSNRVIADPLYSQPFGRMIRAELLFEQGRFEEALPIYLSFLSGYQFEDMSSIGWAYKRRAENFDELGQDSLAIRWYSQFVETWRDADEPLQVYVADARKRLEELPRAEAN